VLFRSIEQLTKLGGVIEGGIFPISEEGPALSEIKNNWDSKFHTHFAGKK
jgi:hypothetical protein